MKEIARVTFSFAKVYFKNMKRAGLVGRKLLSPERQFWDREGGRYRDIYIYLFIYI